jgi:hypothetical protein
MDSSNGSAGSLTHFAHVHYCDPVRFLLAEFDKLLHRKLRNVVKLKTVLDPPGYAIREVLHHIFRTTSLRRSRTNLCVVGKREQFLVEAAIQQFSELLWCVGRRKIWTAQRRTFFGPPKAGLA